MNYNTNIDYSKVLIPVGRAKDITGERFGRLTVIGRTHNIKNYTAWLCKCDCGNYKIVTTSGLKSGDYVSCGCKRKELNTPHDIKGKRFGRLTAIELSNKRSKSGEAYWRCKCDCGNITEVRKSKLSSGETKSCGCLARELTSERQSKRGLNLTGKRFGRLVAIKPTGKKTPEGRVWYCECDCGGSIETTARSLNSGRTTSCGCKQREHATKLGLSNVGKNNPAYNHNLTDEQRATNKFHRTSYEAKRLRTQAYTRDGFKCRVCGGNDKRIVAHHLESFADNIDARFELDNLVTLCEGCHISFHKEYGYGNNTREQFEEFYKKHAKKRDNKIRGNFKALVNS